MISTQLRITEYYLSEKVRQNWLKMSYWGSHFSNLRDRTEDEDELEEDPDKQLVRMQNNVFIN